MAEIVLIWNTHLNESAVTKVFAEKLKINLERRGHIVHIEKTPSDYSEHKCIDALNYAPKSDEFIQHVRDRHPRAQIISVHTTPDYRLLVSAPGQKKLDFKKMKNLRAVQSPNRNTPEGQIILLPNNGPLLDGFYTLEVPAKYRTASNTLKAMHAKQVPEPHMFNAPARQRIERYFSTQADLKATRTANYLNPEVIGKTAHLIDTVVRTESGEYHTPRRQDHKKRDFLKYWTERKKNEAKKYGEIRSRAKTKKILP